MPHPGPRAVERRRLRAAPVHTALCVPGACADLQEYLSAGARPSASLEMAVRAPARYGIATMPQPLSAAQMLASALRADLSGTLSLHPLCRGAAPLQAAWPEGCASCAEHVLVSSRWL